MVGNTNNPWLERRASSFSQRCLGSFFLSLFAIPARDCSLTSQKRAQPMVVVTVSRVLIRKHKLRHRVLREGYTCSNDVSMIDRIDTTTTTKQQTILRVNSTTSYVAVIGAQKSVYKSDQKRTKCYLR